MNSGNNSKEFTFECAHCNYKTNRGKIFAVHKKFMHKGQSRPYQRDQRKNNNSSFPLQFKKDIKILEPNAKFQWSVFQCKLCNLVTDSVGFLALHNQNAHASPVVALERLDFSKLNLKTNGFNKVVHLCTDAFEKIAGENTNPVDISSSKEIVPPDSNICDNDKMATEFHKTDQHSSTAAVSDVNNYRNHGTPRWDKKNDYKHNDKQEPKPDLNQGKPDLKTHENELYFLRPDSCYEKRHTSTYHCDKCDFKTTNKHYLRLHQRIHKNGKKFSGSYSCDQCEYKTNNKYFIVYHKKRHQEVIQPYHYCDKCDFKTEHKKYLPLHKLCHQNRKKFSGRYNCEQCDYKTNSQGALHNHKKRQQTGTTAYHCAVCTYETNFKTLLINHQLRRHLHEKQPGPSVINKISSPNITNRTTTSRSTDVQSEQKPKLTFGRFNLKTNKKQKFHPQDPYQNPKKFSDIYDCKLCNYKTNRKCKLQNHQQCHLENNDSESNPTEIRHSQLGNQSHLINYNAEDNNSSISILALHNQDVHSLPVIALDSLGTSNKLNIITERGQIRSKSKISENNKIREADDSNSERNLCGSLRNTSNIYKCEECDYETHQKYDFSLHQRHHRSLKQQPVHFSCVKCDFVTDNIQNLNDHDKRLHSQRQKLYSCKQCNFKCELPDDLHSHIQLAHQAAYQCEFCDYSTRRLYKLANHRIRHNNPGVLNCNHCSFKTNILAHLEQHEIFKHRKETVEHDRTETKGYPVKGTITILENVRKDFVKDSVSSNTFGDVEFEVPDDVINCLTSTDSPATSSNPLEPRFEHFQCNAKLNVPDFSQKIASTTALDSDNESENPKDPISNSLSNSFELDEDFDKYLFANIFHADDETEHPKNSIQNRYENILETENEPEIPTGTTERHFAIISDSCVDLQISEDPSEHAPKKKIKLKEYPEQYLCTDYFFDEGPKVSKTLTPKLDNHYGEASGTAFSENSGTTLMKNSKESESALPENLIIDSASVGISGDSNAEVSNKYPGEAFTDVSEDLTDHESIYSKFSDWDGGINFDEDVSGIFSPRNYDDDWPEYSDISTECSSSSKDSVENTLYAL